MGTLLRTTLQQVGQVREAVERQARTQRVWLDGALLQRKYRESLLKLGELVYELIATGELDELRQDPDIAAALAHIEDLEAQLHDASAKAREQAEKAMTSAGRFAARAGIPGADLMMARGRRTEPRSRSGEPGEDMRVWRPVMPDDDDDPFDDPLDDPVAGAPFDFGDVGEDGTVSAVTPPASAPQKTTRPPRRRAARKGSGGITFVTDDPIDEDEDLEQYMHEDDVPAASEES